MKIFKQNTIKPIKDNYQVKKVGRTYRVDPCPICGRKDHFTIYPETNSYSSFSKCCTGGSVYKYLQETQGLTEESAYEVKVEQGIRQEIYSLKTELEETKRTLAVGLEERDKVLMQAIRSIQERQLEQSERKEQERALPWWKKVFRRG